MPFAKVKFIFFLNIKSSLFTFCCFGFVFRLQQEAELKLLEEETAKRLEEAIQKNVEERLNSEEVKLDIERRVVEGRKKLLDDVTTQLEKEKEVALAEARLKQVSCFYNRSVLPIISIYILSAFAP